MKTIFIPVFAFLFLSFYLQAQTPMYRHYTVDDGLPSSEVYSVLQDSKGYLWFGTENGVSRFNGYQFENLNKEGGLPDNVVFKLYEDFKGRIWFTTLSCRLSYYDRGQIHEFPYNEQIQKIIKKGDYVHTSLYVDSSETIYFGIQRLGHIIITKTGEVDHVQPEKLNSYLLKIKKDHWIFSVSGDSLSMIEKNFGIIDLETSQTTILRHLPIGAEMNWKLTAGNNFYIFPKEDSLLMKVDLSSGDLDTLQLSLNGISLFEDHHSNLWLGTQAGLFKYPDANIREQSQILLAGQVVSGITEDHENGIWVTTAGNGIFYMPSPEITAYTRHNNLSDGRILCSELVDDKLWLGYENGKMDRIGETFESFDPGFMSVNELIATEGKKMTIFTSGEVYEWDGFQFLKKGANIYYNICGIAFKNNSYLLGGRHGLSIYDAAKGASVLLYENNSYILRTYDILPDTLDRYWLASLYGLWQVDMSDYPDKTAVYNYYGDKHPLFKEKIRDLYKSANGWLWIATAGAGIVVNTGDTIFNITTDDGLLSNFCTSVIMDSTTVWIGTNNGLNKLIFDNSCLKKFRIESFTKNAGLASNEIKQVYVNKGKIYAVANDGVSIFDKKTLKPNAVPPPIHIDAISILQKDTAIRDFYDLEHDQNFISITYHGLSFKNTANVLYKYRVKEISDKWIFTQNTTISFPQLSPGAYRFEVLAINENGYESTLPAVVSFKINDPWWATWWFKGILGAILLFLLWFTFNIQLKAVRKRAFLQQKASEAEQKALRAQLNPHFIFNTLNSIQGHISRDEKKSASDYLFKFVKLMRLVLENSRENFVILENEIEALKNYMSLEQLQRSHQFDFTIEVHGSFDIHEIKLPPMMIQPHIENAIIHGITPLKKKGFISVNFQKEDTCIICTVEDNGIGRKKAKELQNAGNNKHRSLSVQILNERLELLSKSHKRTYITEITDLEKDGHCPGGTRVVIKLPFIYA